MSLIPNRPFTPQDEFPDADDASVLDDDDREPGPSDTTEWIREQPETD